MLRVNWKFSGFGVLEKQKERTKKKEKNVDNPNEAIILNPFNDRHKYIFKPPKSLDEAKVNINISSKLRNLNKFPQIRLRCTADVPQICRTIADVPQK